MKKRIWIIPGLLFLLFLSGTIRDPTPFNVIGEVLILAFAVSSWAVWSLRRQQNKSGKRPTDTDEGTS
jgi:hypothetical protein